VLAPLIVFWFSALPMYFLIIIHLILRLYWKRPIPIIHSFVSLHKYTHMHTSYNK